MPAIRRFNWVDLLLLVLVLASAAGARAGYLIAYAENGTTAGPLRVQDARTKLDANLAGQVPNRSEPTDLDLLVHNLHEHQVYATVAPFSTGMEDTAHVAPGYPHLVALLAYVVSADRLESALRWGNCGLGALTAALYFLFARRAFRSLVVGALAGLLAALHPFWIIDVANLDDGTLATFLLALSLFLGARASQTGGPFGSLLFGLTLAGLALVRAALLPFAFVAIVWFLLRTRNLRRGWLPAVLAFLGFLIGLSPWTVRNLQVFGEPLPIVDSAYLHLWIGNNPAATGGPNYRRALDRASEEELRKIDAQPKRYDELGKKVAEEAKDGPNTMRRRIRSALAFFLGAEWFATGRLARPTGEGAMPEWVENAYPTVLHATLLGMLVLGLIGWRWSYVWRWESMPLALAMVFVPLPYVLSHAEMLSGPRLPLDGVLLCYAAFVLGCLLPGGGSYLREGIGAGEAMQEMP